MSPAFPQSTYRLQLHAGFTFDDARAVLDYLSDLGVSDVYLSPILRAEAGSLHGYNVCAYDQLNPELGGDEGFATLSDEARRRGLRLLVDFVPNHMGIASGENAIWNDVLENGPSSRYADVFDVDWEPGKESLHARVLLPILGEQYGEALDDGKLVLARKGGTFVLRYYDHELPVAPRSLQPLLDLAAEKLRAGETSETSETKEEDPDLAELLSVATATRNLPERIETSYEKRVERAREKEVIKRRLDDLTSRSDRARAAVDEVVALYNGTKGDPPSFDHLDAFLREQSYRLSYWRVASEEINYRRFFDVNQLAAVRMELAPVFEMAHARILALVAEGRIDGLRLDHTDGLRDPADYFAALRRAAGRPLHIVAEKILEHGERLPRSWEIDGTTGYDALALLGGVWVDAKAEAPLTALYRRFTGDTLPFDAHVLEGKLTVTDASFVPEMNLLARALERIAQRSRRSRDFTFGDLRQAIVATMGAFPVYRTYVRPDGTRGPNDDRHIALATGVAKRRGERVDDSVFDFLRQVLLMKERLPESDDATEEARTSFAMRFQQMTGPIMAKGVEDTAFYRYTRCVALNEVGGDPSRFGTSVRELHEAAQARLREWPQSLVATSTHDTKRGEDVRARLAVLTERPDRWEACVDSWLRLAEKHRRAAGDDRMPASGDLYLLFQSALGAWPFAPLGADREAFVKRLVDYMTKAGREAKVHGSWLRPNAEYEEATSALVRGLFADETFVGGVQALADETATYAVTNALASVAVKVTGPGVPDTYQGSEMWNLSLVDPDNRGEVDFGTRRRLLGEIRQESSDRLGLVRRLLDRYADGAIKLYVTHTLLALRRELPALHLAGAYRPIDAGDHVVAFTREHEGRTLACVVPRLPWTLTKGQAQWPVGGAVWGDRTMALPANRWRNVLTGEKRQFAGDAPLREVLENFPIAVLLAE
jgi:(1->4)-alpha-D-glucan 1-alpha-D-glucosylmutase